VLINYHQIGAILSRILQGSVCTLAKWSG